MKIPLYLISMSLVVLLGWAVNAAANPHSDSQAFAGLLKAHWQHAQQEKMFFRTDPDAFRLNGSLPDVSAAGRAKRAQFNQHVLQRLAQIESDKLTVDEQLSYRLFQYERQSEAKHYQQPDHLFPMNIYAGYHSYFAAAPDNMSFLTEEDYQQYLLSLADFPRYNQQQMDNLQEAVDKGLTHHCQSFKDYHLSISKHVVEYPGDSALFQPFTHMPSSIPAARQAAFRTQGIKLIEQRIVPEYRKLLDFFSQVYMASCRQQAGLGALSGGADYYQYLIEYYTTTQLQATTIHELGLSEVARIRSQMRDIMGKLGFTGSLAQFIDFLRTDPQFYASSEQQLLEKVSYITRKVAGQLPKWFITLPRTPFDIKSSPSGGAYYVSADGSGTTSGTYFIGTDNLTAQPLYNLEALTLHEAEPGHHLDNGLTLEQHLPEFRKTLYHSAYGEGWALYAESLGKDMGFYQDPYSDFGRLTYEAWRACRLVVDTGIHAMGWTRQQAIDYLADNTALSMPDVINQIDRYISWPGQALSYKIGELKIQQLRKTAKQQLGKRFDIRQFHEQILKNGSLPLDLLEELTMEWIAAQNDG